jgi:hypothetical protein
MWLRGTALKHLADVPAFNEYVLFGNEDCPRRVELYAEPVLGVGYNPALVFPKPVACYDSDENGDLSPSQNMEPQ